VTASFDKLQQSLRKLPGLGYRSAERIALHLVVENPARAAELIDALKEAAEKTARVSLAQAVREAKRNRALAELVSAELREQSEARVEQLQAALEQAIVHRDKAKLDLMRTKVVAGVSLFSTATAGNII
jgi:multidrug resistance efflux pump